MSEFEQIHNYPWHIIGFGADFEGWVNDCLNESKCLVVHNYFPIWVSLRMDDTSNYGWFKFEKQGSFDTHHFSGFFHQIIQGRQTPDVFGPWQGAGRAAKGIRTLWARPLQQRCEGAVSAHCVGQLTLEMGIDTKNSGMLGGKWWSTSGFWFTLWLFNIAMENGPFIDGLPIENSDFPWLC